MRGFPRRLPARSTPLVGGGAGGPREGPAEGGEFRMSSYRGLFRVGAALAMTFAVVVGSVFADEFFGVITKVDVEAKKITVFEKKTDKESVLEVDDEAVLVTPKNEAGSKIDLKKLDDRLTKAREKNADAKGVRAKITHEGGKVSKIEIAKKKAFTGQ